MDRNKATNALRRYSGVGKKEKYCYICTKQDLVLLFRAHISFYWQEVLWAN